MTDSDKAKAINLFKELFEAFSNRYQGRWTDGSKSHYQSMAREWIPTIANDINLISLENFIVNFNSDKGIFKTAPPTLDELVSYLSGANQVSANNFEDPIESAVSQVLIQSAIDYSSFAYKGIESPSEHKAMVDAWCHRLKEFGVEDPIYISMAYESFVRNPSYKSFPPKLTEIAHKAISLQNEKITSDSLPFISMMEDFYSNCVVRYGKYFGGDVPKETLVKEWVSTLSAYKVDNAKKLSTALCAVKMDLKFASKSPNIMDVVFEYHTEGLDSPSEDEAFQMAIGNKPGTIHPVVSHTRKQIGTNLLMRSTNEFLKKEFCKKYRENLVKHAMGQLDIHSEKEVEILNEKKIDKEKGISLIQKLLNK